MKHTHRIIYHIYKSNGNSLHNFSNLPLNRRRTNVVIIKLVLVACKQYLFFLCLYKLRIFFIKYFRFCFGFVLHFINIILSSLLRFGVPLILISININDVFIASNLECSTQKWWNLSKLTSLMDVADDYAFFFFFYFLSYLLTIIILIYFLLLNS